MLKAKSELAKHLEKEILKVVYNNETCKAICEYANNTYDIPKGMTSDYISMRIDLNQASEFVLFCLLDSFEKITKVHNTVQDKYFTMQEVKTYRTSKFEIDKIKFPIKFKVVKIAEDQFIGKIDIAMMMKLRAAQLINYNVNAQRTMSKIIKGGKEIYKITINQAAVNSIAELYKKNIYIPTPFTLNISEDKDADFYYDEENSELVVKSIENFDITDGYHRFIAACQVNDANKEFNYSMELRITNWSEDKAKQFIWQEDQKTHMRKVDSDSLNMNKAANIVVTRLNESPACNLQGLISRNNGIINFGDLAELVNYFFFKNGNTKEKEKSQIISVTKQLTDCFNLLTEHDMKYIEKEYTYKELVAIMCTFNYFISNGKDVCKITQIIDKVIEKTMNLDNKKFYLKTPKKSMMNDIESIIAEVE